jgi:hypothetical protein
MSGPAPKTQGRPLHFLRYFKGGLKSDVPCRSGYRQETGPMIGEWRTGISR